MENSLFLELLGKCMQKNMNFITAKISIPHLLSQSTPGKQVVLTPLCSPPRDPNTFFCHEDNLHVHNSVIYLGKDGDCWKMNFRNCCHQFVPPSPLLSSPPWIVLSHLVHLPVWQLCGGERVSSRALSWGAEYWCWHSFWDKPSNVAYQNPGL